MDNENPFIIANNFLKKYPNLDPVSAKDHIKLELISSILSKCTNDFHLTGEEFDTLRNIEPNLIEFPVKNKKDLVKLVGKYGDSGTAGAYVFKNKFNGFYYVGSSISLAKRLSTGYFGLNLGDRKIDLAIRDAGLDSFFLYLYILPNKLVGNLENTVDKRKIQILTLALEQILILLFNPEYNVLKVASSLRGYKHSAEALQKISEVHRGKTVSKVTKKKISDAQKGEGNSFYGKTHNEETLKKMSEGQKGRTHSEETKTKIREAKISEAKGTTVEVLDIETNEKKEYISIRQAAADLNTYPMTILRCIKNKKNLLDRYQIKKKE